MPRDYKLYLEDIIESVEKIREYVTGMEFDQFCGDRKTQDAVVRNLEVIGEAARNLPDEINYYKLEFIHPKGYSTRHGPVKAVPR